MDIKKGASLEGIKPEAKRAIEVIDEIYIANGANLTITSGTEGKVGDGVHKDTSLHYAGYAFDCRIWVFKNPMHGQTDMKKVNAVAKQIREALGKDYDVLVETDHIHVEFDPKTTVGTIVRDLKRFIDIVAKFIGDITPFYRMIQRYLKNRKG